MLIPFSMTRESRCNKFASAALVHRSHQSDVLQEAGLSDVVVFLSAEEQNLNNLEPNWPICCVPVAAFVMHLQSSSSSVSQGAQWQATDLIIQPVAVLNR